MPVCSDDKMISSQEALADWGDIRIGLEELDEDLAKALTKRNSSAVFRARDKISNLKKALTRLTMAMVLLEKTKENV